MKLSRIICSVSLVCVLQSCAGHGGIHTGKMLSAVPSDAQAFVTAEKLGDILSGYIDSSDVLNTLHFGDLKNNSTALSYCNTSSLTPVLAVDAGKADCQALVSEAVSVGLQARLLGQGVLVLSPSGTLVSSVERHLEEGASVMDAVSFPIAAQSVADSRNAVFLRTSGASGWLPADFPGGKKARSETASFLSNLCDWIVATPCPDGSWTLKLSALNTLSSYMRILESGSSGHILADKLAPENADLVISESVSASGFRNLYRAYLDATVRLDAYNRNLHSIADASGVDIVGFEKQLDVREVSRLSWDGHDVSLLRCGTSVRDTLFSENTARGAVAALYGKAFAVDDVWVCRRDRWIAFGSREDVEAFSVLSARKSGNAARSFYYKDSNIIAFRDNKAIRLWKSSR